MALFVIFFELIWHVDFYNSCVTLHGRQQTAFQVFLHTRNLSRKEDSSTDFLVRG